MKHVFGAVFLIILLISIFVFNTNSFVQSAECSNATLKVIPRNEVGFYIPGIKFQVFEQTVDIDGYVHLGKLVASGEVDSLGRGNVSFNPSQNQYTLRIYDQNRDLGSFEFPFIPISCGQTKEVPITLSSLSITLKDGAGVIQSDRKISVYSQAEASDGGLYRKEFIVSKNTSGAGSVTFYLAADNPYTRNTEGVYAFSVLGDNRIEYIEYDVLMRSEIDKKIDYVFSDIIFSLKDGADSMITDRPYIEVHNQRTDALGNKIIEDQIKSIRLDQEGRAWMQYPHGVYAVTIKDSLDQSIIFNDVGIKKNQRTELILKTNKVQLLLTDTIGRSLPEGTNVNVYALDKVSAGKYKQGSKINNVSIGDDGSLDLRLASGPYLFLAKEKLNEYARAIYVVQGVSYSLNLKIQSDYLHKDGKIYSLEEPVITSDKDVLLAEKLKGSILLQVESRGEAWYVNKENLKRYYMKDGVAAYSIMRNFGLGISNKDLAKIPVGFEERFKESDIDGDGLSDKLEESFGTGKNDPDSDDDGYNDGDEIKNGYSPLGKDSLSYDDILVERLVGNIVLQVESRGEAWYINPKDKKRYYMTDGIAAYEIMRYLSLGITNLNLEKITEGTLKD